MRTADNGNGTFTNPLVFLDLPDPDIIRVGDDFYLVASSFTCAPGLPICHSRDLVNWELIGHVYDRLEGDPAYDLVAGKAAYRGGSWAPSIRYHAGRFHVGYCTPGEGFHLATAADPRGPWTITRFGVELYDPGLFFAADGQAYVVHGANGICLSRLKPDLSGVDGEPVPIFETPVGTPLEGSHLYARDGWFYLCLTSRGYNGIQLCLRSRTVTGPYAWRVLTGDDLNYAGAGVHQGGFVELADGSTWFFMFQDRDWVGRVPVLFPVRWEDGWPVIGDPANHGKLPVTCPLPISPAGPRRIPAGSDDFSTATLKPFWEWNHNPDPSRWSLSARPGYLRLTAGGPAGSVAFARNTLTQRVVGPASTARVRLDPSGLLAGDRAGLGIINLPFAELRVSRRETDLWVEMTDEEHVIAGIAVPLGPLILEVAASTDGLARFAVGPEGQPCQPLGQPFVMRFTPKTFLGNRFGLFCYRPDGNPGGWADFTAFDLSVPGSGTNLQRLGDLIPAVAYDAESGTDTQRLVEKQPAQALVNLNHGDWVRFAQVELAGAVRAVVSAAPLAGGQVEFHRDTPDGPLLGTCFIPDAGNRDIWNGPFSEFSCALSPTPGIGPLCLVMVGPGRYLFRLQHFRLEKNHATVCP